MSLKSGSHLGRFEIQGMLGKGGMGEVYRAVDPRLGRQVALKVLPEALARESQLRARLEREARFLAALDHPNVGAIYELDENKGRTFLVMQLV